MRLGLLVLTLAALLAAPVGASASRYRVGIGEQDPTMFTDAAFGPLHLKLARYVAAWDWRRNPVELDAFIGAARRAGVRPLIHFGASANCFDGRRYRLIRRCQLPSPHAYAVSIRAFRRTYPDIRDFGAWNEANHKSQPTYKAPRRAAQYYNELRKACRRCTIVAADLLDDGNILPYLERFRRFTLDRPRIWGLHNYSDVNRSRSTVTRAFLAHAPGQVWLTETGGLVRFVNDFHYSETRARARTGYLFALADKYSRPLPGLRSRITRVYPYEWKGEPRGARFDAGLVGPDGRPRLAYARFRDALMTRSK